MSDDEQRMSPEALAWLSKLVDTHGSVRLNIEIQRLDLEGASPRLVSLSLHYRDREGAYQMHDAVDCPIELDIPGFLCVELNDMARKVTA